MVATERKSVSKRSLLQGELELKDSLGRALLANAETNRRARDDITVRELGSALRILLHTANSCGTVWLCGSGSGISSALDAEYRLTIGDLPGQPVRARALGLNPVSHAAFEQEEPVESLSNELHAFGHRDSDCLWCFAVEAGNESVLNAARYAKEKLRIPVISFTGMPGTPLIRFATAKIQVQPAGEEDHSHRIHETHTLLYLLLVQRVRMSGREYVFANTED